MLQGNEPEARNKSLGSQSAPQNSVYDPKYGNAPAEATPASEETNDENNEE